MKEIKDETVKKMEDSMGEMMEMNTPVLWTVENIALLPFRIMTSRIALQAAIYTLLPALALREAVIYAGFASGSFFAGLGVEALIQAIKNVSESDAKSKLTELFQKEGLTIHSFNKGGEIPYSLMNHVHLAEGFSGAVSGDLIRLSYRGYDLICCNIALTQKPVEGFTDLYRKDDEEARQYFGIQEEKNVVFYGSVFMFFPGPAIRGDVRLAASSPIEYLRELQETDLGSFAPGPEYSEQRMNSFHRYHFVEGENSGNELEPSQVFTQRVKDMILQLEWQMRAPAAVYANQNIVCLSVQNRVYDFQCIHNIKDPSEEIASELYGKIASFKNILDTIIGPEGAEYTELLGDPSEQRKSVYSPFFTPFRELHGLEDDDVQRYVLDMMEWMADIYRFVLHYSEAYRKAYEKLDYVSSKFLLAFLAHVDLEQAMDWYDSPAGRKLKDSLTEVVVGHFRYIWSSSGICEVRNIRRNEGFIPEAPTSKITCDIVVNPPVRKMEYLSETNERMVYMCDPSHFTLRQLNDAKIQKELVDTFAKNLKDLNSLRYGDSHTYRATINLNTGEIYGMKPDEVIKLGEWYDKLLRTPMELNGTVIKMDEKDGSKKR